MSVHNEDGSVGVWRFGCALWIFNVIAIGLIEVFIVQAYKTPEFEWEVVGAYVIGAAVFDVLLFWAVDKMRMFG